MKSSYTKRALAFWLAVAMVATSAPMAFATETVPGTTSPASTTTNSTPTVTDKIDGIELKKDGEVLSNAVTADGSTEVTLAIQAKKSGAGVSDPSGLTYTLAGSVDGSGVSISGTDIKVSGKAKAGQYTVVCDQDQIVKASFTVQRNPAVATTINNIYVDQIEVSDTKFIPIVAGSAAKQITANVSDQYGDQMPNAQLTFEVSGDEKVQVDNGRLVVNKTATAGDVTVTVKSGSVQATFKVKVEAAPAEDDEVQVSFKNLENIVYTGSGLAKDPEVTASDEGGSVTYTYYKKVNTRAAGAAIDKSEVKDVGTYHVVAKYVNGSEVGYVEGDFEITKKPITVTADDKTITKGDAIPTLTFSVTSGALVDGDTKDALGVKLTTTATSSSPAGTYNITGTGNSKNYNVAVTSGNLTIEAEEGLRMVASKSSEDSNRSRYDLSARHGTGYLDLNADADDYLNRQTVDDEKDYWIGFDLNVYVDGNSTSVDNLYVSSTGKSSWEKISSLKNSERYIGEFYLDNLGSDNSFTLWFNTDDDTDNSDRLYFATSNSGTNKYYIDVDFDSYSGSSSSSSGSSSSNTSKKDGDRVSTTTVDKTPSVKNGSATVTFSSSALSDALDDNKKEAKREKADKTYIELDVKNSKSVDDTTITVPRSSLDKLADEDTGLKLTTNQGTVTFDYRALAEIYDACDKTNIEFYLEEEDDDQYVLLIKDGSSDVIDLGRGSVEVTFDYKLKSGEKSSDVKVYRIGNGDKTWLSTYGGSTVYGAADIYAAAPAYVTDMKADYSSSKKKVTFTTDALGTFLITTDTLKTGSGSTTTTPTYNAFVDVPSSRWSATYINKLASLGIINGTGGGYFEPTLYVTREEFVKMLAGVAGANVTGYTSSRFPDVPLSRWSAPYIAWAADRGITTGTDGGNFAPAMRITREEMATMIYRYVQSAGETLPAKNTPVIFADANLISGWAQTPVSVMQQAGIIDGNVTNGRYTFDPKVSASREECAKMLAVLYDLVR